MLGVWAACGIGELLFYPKGRKKINEGNILVKKRNEEMPLAICN